MVALMLTAMLLGGEVSDAREWTRLDTALQTTFVVVAALDWAQTQSFVGGDSFHEVNPILGREPSAAKVAAFFGVMMVGHTAIAYALPKPWRTAWQCVWIGSESGAVARNHQLGVRIRW